MTQNICVQCGIDVDEQKVVKRSGRLFCSEDCAQKDAQKSEDKCGCCC